MFFVTSFHMYLVLSKILTEGVEEPITSPEDATSEDLKKELGEIPRKNPMVTIAAALRTGERGVMRVARALMRIVDGSSKPRAIWKNEASTFRRQSVLNTIVVVVVVVVISIARRKLNHIKVSFQLDANPGKKAKREKER
jgi:hypothetical protein